ncbi:unnamed protein product [Lathyrus oleraceus]|uniref:Pectinesterase n=1 Tax=Pisum sativum TaxID=3888 RepID=A0A9D5BI26_PEA|nr:probable pectinesterase 29 [Pisum sativum]KAI5444119.1 hypothetical protein KIW84_012652 [Pisum sativum]
MFIFRLFIISFLFLALRVDKANAQLSYKKVRNKLLSYSEIFVDPSGHGNFTTIQSAIDSIPSNNKHWMAIRVKVGTYREKVVIPEDKPYILLKGSGKRKTLVEWNDHSDLRIPTFSSLADNIVVKAISFRNSYNNPINNKPKLPAIAAKVSGDKTYFFRVGFYGYQDTLYDSKGRHYYKLCTIQGAVDFIFGAGQSLFERCSISVIGDGYITAQGRESPNDSNGFVVKDSHVFGNATTYLGRAWRQYARVLFYNTNLTNVIQPLGWDSWSFSTHENLITFAEYGNFGPSAETSKRVGWVNKLDKASIENMASVNFIDHKKEWIYNHPH